MCNSLPLNSDQIGLQSEETELEGIWTRKCQPAERREAGTGQETGRWGQSGPTNKKGPQPSFDPQRPCQVGSSKTAWLWAPIRETYGSPLGKTTSWKDLSTVTFEARPRKLLGPYPIITRRVPPHALSFVVHLPPPPMQLAKESL